MRGILILEVARKLIKITQGNISSSSCWHCGKKFSIITD